MSAVVTIVYVERPELKSQLLTKVEGFFEKYPDTWSVTILGSSTNTALEVKVSSPDGLRQFSDWLYTENGVRNLETLLAVAVEKAIA